MNILVIEDQPSELKLIHHVLSAAGHNVSVAPAAEQGLASISADRPQVILLDMALPGMDGLAIVRKLKSDPTTKDIVIICVTSYSERFSKAEAMGLGADAYLLKPLSTRTLPDEIEAIVNKHQSAPSH